MPIAVQDQISKLVRDITADTDSVPDDRSASSPSPSFPWLRSAGPASDDSSTVTLPSLAPPKPLPGHAHPFRQMQVTSPINLAPKVPQNQQHPMRSELDLLDASKASSSQQRKQSSPSTTNTGPGSLQWQSQQAQPRWLGDSASTGEFSWTSTHPPVLLDALGAQQSSAPAPGTQEGAANVSQQTSLGLTSHSKPWQTSDTTESHGVSLPSTQQADSSAPISSHTKTDTTCGRTMSSSLPPTYSNNGQPSSVQARAGASALPSNTHSTQQSSLQQRAGPGSLQGWQTATASDSRAPTSSVHRLSPASISASGVQQSKEASQQGQAHRLVSSRTPQPTGRWDHTRAEAEQAYKRERNALGSLLSSSESHAGGGLEASQAKTQQAEYASSPNSASDVSFGALTDSAADTPTQGQADLDAVLQNSSFWRS